jgi:hypothetical protein
MSDGQHEAPEKQTLLTIAQALQQDSKEAEAIFDTTPAGHGSARRLLQGLLTIDRGRTPS